MNSIKEKETFEIWKSKTLERIDKYKTEIRKNSDLKFDYSKNSLFELENFLLKNYNIDSLKETQNNEILDACISYFGETLIKIIPSSEWHIYLDDKSNIYYGLPCIKTEFSESISVHYLLRDTFNENNGNVLTERIEIILNKDKIFKELLKK